MYSQNLQRLIERIDNYLYDPRLRQDILLQKRWAWIWMVFTCFGVGTTILLFAVTIWQPWMIWIFITFSLCYLFAFYLYPLARRFDLVVNIIYSIFIIVITYVILRLGGFPSSLGLVFAGLNCAMGSILVGSIRWTIGMFVLYILTIISIGILQPYLETPSYVTEDMSRLITVYEITWITACIFLLMWFFIIDRHRMEKAEADRLKKMDEAKTLLYTNVSHEFRTPLTIIQGIADQMEQGKYETSGPQKIKTQSKLLLRLVNQMLDISKIEANEIHLNMVYGNLSKYFRYIIGSFKSLADSRNIKLSLELPAETVYTVYDPEKMMHIMANLLSNAIKFTPEGGHVDVRLSTETGQKDKTVNISVRDTGKGIPAEEREKIFQRFYQVPDNNVQTEGTGLGLTLTKELVHLMGGYIRVQSSPGKGSEFIIDLPLKENGQRSTDDMIEPVHLENIKNQIIFEQESKNINDPYIASPGKPMLLIVEDNNEVMQYLVSVLKPHYSIRIAYNGKFGLEAAIKFIPDFILTDIMMPQMDGLEMIKELRQNILTDHIPIVVLTARGDFPSKISGLETGADHYLVKPFSEKELLLKLNNLMTARTKMQQKLSTLPVPVDQMKATYKQEVQFISKVNSALDKHLSEEDFGIKEICFELNLSRPQFYRKFTALTNKPIGRYIRSYRLHKAKQMIEKEGNNVTEAAMNAGFKNLSHFSSSFKEEFGYPPSQIQ